jgi:hypothetical protein
VLIPRHSEFLERASSEASKRNGQEWNSAEKIIPSPYTALDSDEESEEDEEYEEEEEKDDVNVEERKDESEFSDSDSDDGLFVTSASSESHKEPTSYVEDRTPSRYWFFIYLLYIYVTAAPL